MEKQQKELLNFLDMHIECTRGLGKDFREDLIMFQALRRLVEKFYGEWQKDANNLNIDFVEWPELVVLVESIRDFDPMTEKLFYQIMDECIFLGWESWSKRKGLHGLRKEKQ